MRRFRWVKHAIRLLVYGFLLFVGLVILLPSSQPDVTAPPVGDVIFQLNASNGRYDLSFILDANDPVDQDRIAQYLRTELIPHYTGLGCTFEIHDHDLGDLEEELRDFEEFQPAQSFDLRKIHFRSCPPRLGSQTSIVTFDLAPIDQLFQSGQFESMTLDARPTLAQQDFYQCQWDPSTFRTCQARLGKGLNFPKVLRLKTNPVPLPKVSTASSPIIPAGAETMPWKDLGADVQLISDFALQRGEGIAHVKLQGRDHLLIYSGGAFLQQRHVQQKVELPRLRPHEVWTQECLKEGLATRSGWMLGSVDTSSPEREPAPRHAFRLEAIHVSLVALDSDEKSRVKCRRAASGILAVPRYKTISWQSLSAFRLSGVFPAVYAPLFEAGKSASWKIDLDGDGRAEHLVHLRHGQASRTCLVDASGRTLNCALPALLDPKGSPLRSWLIQLDASPEKELLLIHPDGKSGSIVRFEQGFQRVAKALEFEVVSLRPGHASQPFGRGVGQVAPQSLLADLIAPGIHLLSLETAQARSPGPALVFLTPDDALKEWPPLAIHPRTLAELISDYADGQKRGYYLEDAEAISAY